MDRELSDPDTPALIEVIAFWRKQQRVDRQSYTQVKLHSRCLSCRDKRVNVSHNTTHIETEQRHCSTAGPWNLQSSRSFRFLFCWNLCRVLANVILLKARWHLTLVKKKITAAKKSKWTGERVPLARWTDARVQTSRPLSQKVSSCWNKANIFLSILDGFSRSELLAALQTFKVMAVDLWPLEGEGEVTSGIFRTS